MRGHARAVRILVLVLAALLSAGVGAADAQQWPTGHVSFFLDYLPNREDTVELRSRIFVEKTLEPQPYLRITLSGFAEGLIARRSSRVSDAIARPHDANVELTSRKLSVLIGYARVVWGKLDELQPTDVVNPLDASRFFFEGRSEARLPVAVVRGRMFLSEDTTIDGIYVPVFRRGRFDQLDEDSSPFNPAADPGQDLVVCLALPCPTLPPVVERQTRPVTAANAQGGVRFSTTSGRVDWSLSAYRGFESFGIIEAAPQTAGPLVLLETHPRFTMFGGDFESVRGPWGMRGEAAVFPEDSFQSASLQRVAGRSFDAGVGVDRRAGDYTVSGTMLVHSEWYDRPLTNRADESDGRVDVSLIASADRTFAREKYRLRTFGVYNVSESSGFLRGIGFIYLRDNLSLEGSAGWFIGEGRDLVGRFSRNDFGYGRLKYHF